MHELNRSRRLLHLGPGMSRSTSSDLLHAERLETGQTPQRALSGTPGVATAGRYASRPAELRDAVSNLDAGLDENTRREVAAWIGGQYLTSYGEVPLGFLAVCHLGPPYVDHQLNLAMMIVRHFAPQDSVPEPFAQARMLVRSGGYSYVEVYSGGLLLPVLDDGTVVRP